MSHIRLNRVFFCLVVLIASFAPSAWAQDRTSTTDRDIVILFDSSASMLMDIEGTPKIDLARSTTNELLELLPNRQQVGLVTFGHGTTSHCGSIETRVPIGQNRDQIRESLAEIEPRGFTPLSSAIEQVAKDFTGRDRPVDIVLISDGGDQCFRDPCEIAKQVEAANAQFTAHVVASGDGDEVNIPVLQCIARATGGRFLTANELTKLAASADTPSAPTVPSTTITRAPSATEVTREVTLRQKVTLRAVTEEGASVANGSTIVWEVFPLDAEGQIGDSAAFGRGGEVSFALAPGRYRVIAAQGEDSRQEVDIVVTRLEPVVREVTFANGTIRLTAHLAKGTPAITSRIFGWIISTADREGNIVQVAREAGDSVRFILPAGSYIGQVRGEDISVDFKMPLRSGVSLDQEVILNAGIVEVFGPERSSWALYTIDANGRERRVASEARAETNFLVAEGAYIAEVSLGRESQRQNIKLVAGETVTIDLRSKPLKRSR